MKVKKGLIRAVFILQIFYCRYRHSSEDTVVAKLAVANLRAVDNCKKLYTNHFGCTLDNTDVQTVSTLLMLQKVDMRWSSVVPGLFLHVALKK